MLAIYRKELNTFFSSLIGYLAIGVFLVILGLIMWVIPSTSVLDYNYATLEQLFGIAPLIFAFLAPAITMRSLSEEKQSGTIELLVTKPLTDLDIVAGKFLAGVTLLAFALLPTLLYVWSIHELGNPKGNLDTGAIAGSYIGLLLLGSTFTGMGMLASALTRIQILAFLLGMVLCISFFFAFDALSELPVFFGKTDDLVQMLGMKYHYESLSRGLIDTRDLVYFLSLIASFLFFTHLALGSRKW